MYIPDDIKEIIWKYHYQLKFSNCLLELKQKIKYIYFSQSFSEIQYYYNKPKIITYYYNEKNLLILHKNDILNNYIINKTTNVIILDYK